MKQNEATRLAENLRAKFGLPLKASLSEQSIIIEPEGIHPNEGFQVIIHIGWRSLFLDLLPGKFAADLLQQMGNSNFEKKSLFADISKHIQDEKAVLVFKINDIPVNPVNPYEWPLNWRTLSFSLRKTPLEINTEDHRLTEQIINLWVERYFSCIIAISPLEEIEDNYDFEGLPEGALTKVVANRYERSRLNRSVCINFHGCTCKICGMNFGKIYGSLGEGFIHVHHIVPVSKLVSGYLINPIKDLVPVCPNCHSMLHRKDPPYSVEELKLLFAGDTN